MRHQADGCEYFIGVLPCNVLSQSSVDFLNSRCVPVCEQAGRRLRCFGEEDNAACCPAQPVDRVCVGSSLLHQAQQGVFQKAAAGERGQPAGFVDGQQMGVVKQDFEVLRGVWFDPRRTIPDKGLA